VGGFPAHAFNPFSPTTQQDLFERVNGVAVHATHSGLNALTACVTLPASCVSFQKYNSTVRFIGKERGGHPIIDGLASLDV
jgi:hypothetical protein